MKFNKEGQKEFYYSRRDIEKSTFLKRHAQLKHEKLLIKLGILKTRTIRFPVSKTFFKLKKNRVKRFFKNPLKYIALLDNALEIFKGLPTHVDHGQHVHVDDGQHVIDKDNIYSIYFSDYYSNNHGSGSFSTNNKVVPKGTTMSPTPGRVVDSGPEDSNSGSMIVPLINPSKQKPKRILFSKILIGAQAIQLYHKLVDEGAVKHKKDSKAYGKSLEALQRCLTKKKKSYHDVVLSSQDKKQRKYLNKVWEPEEILEAFIYGQKINHGKYRNIASFISTDFKETHFSPLIMAHINLTDEKNLYNFNGTAQKILKFVEKETGKAKQFRPGLYLKIGNHIDKRGEKFKGNPNLLYPENKIDFQFTSFLKQKMQNGNFQIHYMFSEKFVDEFFEQAKKKGTIVSASNIR